MSDKKLVNDRIQQAFDKLASKNMSGMDELYEAVGLEVYAMAFSRMDSEASAKALVQEAFVLACRYAKRYRDENNGRDFVLNIVNNLVNKKRDEDKSLFASKLAMKKSMKAAKNTFDPNAEGIKLFCEEASTSEFTYDYVPVKTPEQKKKCYIAIAVLALIIFVLGCAFGGRNKLNSKVVASVYVDAEESIELQVNKKLQVYKAEGCNEESEAYVEALKLEGESLEDALECITGYMYMKGELEPSKGYEDADEESDDFKAAILISISSEDEYFDEVAEAAHNAYFYADEELYSVILQRIDAESVAERAKEAGISVGKYCFIRSIIFSSDKFTDEDFEEASELPIRILAYAYYTYGESDDETDVEKTESEKKDSEDSSKTEESKEEENETAKAGEDEDNGFSNIIVLVKDKTDEIVSDTKDKASEAVSDAVDNAVEGAKDKAEDALEDAVEGAVDSAKEQIPDDVDTDSIKDAIIDFIKGLFK